MLYLIVYISMFLVYLAFMRGTIFEISLKKNRFGGVLVARELFLLVLLGAMLFGVMGASSFNVVHVRDDNLHGIVAIVFLTVFLLFASIAAFSKTIFGKYLCFNGLGISETSDLGRVRWLLRSVFILLILFIMIAHATGTSHAFLRSIVAGEGLMSVRLSNRYQSFTPSHVVAYMRYTFYLAAILVGYFGSRLLAPLSRYIFLIAIFYAASMAGGKAPIVQVFVLYFLANAVQRNYSVKVLCGVGVTSIVGIMALTFITVRIQYPDMPVAGFYVYLMDRLGVGQIQGVFEQFSLGLRDFRYIYIEIPFSGFFFEPKMFSKDLMMNTWAVGMNPEDTGVMNSFFIGEAYAIGGYPFALLSPAIIAFNFCLITYLVVYMLHKRLGLCSLDAKIIAPLFVSSILMFTGDLNGMLIGKRFFFVLVYFVGLYLSVFCLRMIMKPYTIGIHHSEFSKPRVIV